MNERGNLNFSVWLFFIQCKLSTQAPKESILQMRTQKARDLEHRNLIFAKHLSQLWIGIYFAFVGHVLQFVCPYVIP